MNLTKSLSVIILILFLDQWSKIYIKTNFRLEESVAVFDWFYIRFIENDGAAWGMKLSDFIPISEYYAKLSLTIFRIFAIMGIGYWLYDNIRNQVSNILIFAVALIFAGALGNIIDSVFYGVIFDESTRYEIATLFSEQPYGTLFHGRVVDMLHFPIIRNAQWPEWLPIVGGDYFSFFNPIFNLADTSISFGVGLLLVFHKKAFAKPKT